MRRLAISAIFIVVGVYLGSMVLIMLLQRRLIYYPSREILATPDRQGLAYEEVALRTSDGVTLAGWYVPAAEAKGTTLFCHGNGGNISYWIEHTRRLHDLGLSVLLFDYRGYGRSEGKPTEEGTYQDAEAAWRYLVEERRVPPDEIIIHGQSLGGAVASWLAEKHTPRALILESTFTSVPDRAGEMLPLVPMRLIMRIRYDTLERIGRIRCPILIIHSRDDRLLPISHGRRLLEAAPEPKAFLEIHGSHNNGVAESQELFEQGIKAFLSPL